MIVRLSNPANTYLHEGWYSVLVNSAVITHDEPILDAIHYWVSLKQNTALSELDVSYQAAADLRSRASVIFPDMDFIPQDVDEAIESYCYQIPVMIELFKKQFATRFDLDNLTSIFTLGIKSINPRELFIEVSIDERTTN